MLVRYKAIRNGQYPDLHSIIIVMIRNESTMFPPFTPLRLFFALRATLLNYFVLLTLSVSSRSSQASMSSISAHACRSYVIQFCFLFSSHHLNSIVKFWRFNFFLLVPLLHTPRLFEAVIRRDLSTIKPAGMRDLRCTDIHMKRSFLPLITT